MLRTSNGGRMHMFGDDIYISDQWVRDLNDGKIQAIHIIPGDRYAQIRVTIDRPRPSEYSGFEYLDEDDLV